MISNLNDIEGVVYQSKKFRKTDYKNNIDIIDIIYRVYQENLTRRLNNIIIIADFDILLSNLSIKLISDRFLTNITNWEPANIKDISIKTREINNI